MEVLRDLNDHKMLLELCLQLSKVPEPDKLVHTWNFEFYILAWWYWK